MEYKGRLQRWNDERGFGFIKPEIAGQGDVFIHISELKNMSRRPIVGDVIFYQLYTDASGKIKAINARIEGVIFVRPSKRYTPKPEKSSFLSSVIGIFVIVGIVWVAYHKFETKSFISSTENKTKTNSYEDPVPNLVSEKNVTERKNSSDYQCDGRQHCSQMSSCEEAEFFITHCPNTKMDGDNDGIPCEDQFCGH